jgi:hypothetical protein
MVPNSPLFFRSGHLWIETWKTIIQSSREISQHQKLRKKKKKADGGAVGWVLLEAVALLLMQGISGHRTPPTITSQRYAACLATS